MKDELTLIKSLVRGVGTRGDKYPLVEDFDKYWENCFGKERYKIAIKGALLKNWIEKGRYPNKGYKHGKQVYGLVNRYYTVKYLEFCKQSGIDEADLEHHSEYRAGVLYRK